MTQRIERNDQHLGHHLVVDGDKERNVLASVGESDGSSDLPLSEFSHGSFTSDSLTSSSRDAGHGTSFSCSRRFTFYNIPENELENDGNNHSIVYDSLHTAASFAECSDDHHSKGSLPSLCSVLDTDTIQGSLGGLPEPQPVLGVDETSLVEGSRGSLPSLDSICENDTFLESHDLSQHLSYLSQQVSIDSSSLTSFMSGPRRQIPGHEVDQLCPVLTKETENLSHKQRYRWIAATSSGDNLCYTNVSSDFDQRDTLPRMAERQSSIKSIIISPKPGDLSSSKTPTTVHLDRQQAPNLAVRDFMPTMVNRQLSPHSSHSQKSSIRAKIHILTPVRR